MKGASSGHVCQVERKVEFCKRCEFFELLHPVLCLETQVATIPSSSPLACSFNSFSRTQTSDMQRRLLPPFKNSSSPASSAKPEKSSDVGSVQNLRLANSGQIVFASARLNLFLLMSRKLFSDNPTGFSKTLTCVSGAVVICAFC
ncbi:unnamed protein product [Protopolystoma xenopodis]|uniref:Uncharacterized protein n=1 Tax=Protopolystoma xenopodis TaxID=117903 RepID=A0A3S5FCG5_9PLAT|nr:unnamed protein product [Protopolystoma xenopodis]